MYNFKITFEIEYTSGMSVFTPECVTYIEAETAMSAIKEFHKSDKVRHYKTFVTKVEMIKAIN